MITVIALAILAIAAVVASIIVTMRDGYRAVPTRMWSRESAHTHDITIGRLS